MGTRNMTVVVKDGQYRLTKYCQWDGYPGGQGLDALEFLRNLDRTRFGRNLDRAVYATDEQIREFYKECGHDGESEWVTMDVADRFKEKYPQLNRDMGSAEILDLVQKSDNGVMLPPVDISFAADSLFCEWLWLVDLDKGTFEGYKGFNSTPLTPEDRFYDLPTDEDMSKRSSKYYPVKLIHAWSLDQLPADDEFLEIMRPPEAEEEE